MQQARRRRLMRISPKALWVGGTLTAVVALALPKLLPLWRGKMDTRDARAERRESTGGGSVAVTTLTLAGEPLEEAVTVTGTLRAEEAIDVQTEVAGKIVEIAFEEGAPVKRGDLLVRLDDVEARAELSRAKARITKAESLERRLRGLMQKGWTNEQEFEQAQSDYHALLAERELAEAKLAKMELRAPFDGVVGVRSVSLGSYVAPSTRITSLQEVARLKLDFAVAERHAVRLAPGARVSFTVSGDAQHHAAEVYVVEPHVDETTRTVLVRARVRNIDGALRPGALAQVTLTLKTWESALLVPAMAVVTEKEGKSVFVVEGGNAQPRKVETGLRRDEQVQIVKGLSEGEVVVVAGVQSLRAGAAVKVAGRN